MKHAEVRTVLLLALPAVAVLVFASVWTRKQEHLAALEAARDVKFVRVIESVVVREPAATATIKKWRAQEAAKQRQLLAGGANGLRQLVGGPPLQIAPKDGLLYRVTFFVPDMVAVSSGIADATDTVSASAYCGEEIRRQLTGSRYVHEEIFDVSKMKNRKHIKFSVTLNAAYKNKSRTVTDTKVVDLTKL